MFIVDEVSGDMTIRQGDTGIFTVEGINDDYTAYFSVYDKNREILLELETTPVDGVATFTITPANSNTLTVPNNKRAETYYYGIKRCKDGFEDTMIVGDKEVPDLNKITVYPLTTEGDENE